MVFKAFMGWNKFNDIYELISIACHHDVNTSFTNSAKKKPFLLNTKKEEWLPIKKKKKGRVTRQPIVVVKQVNNEGR